MRTPGRIILEALLISVAGLVFGLAANSISPKGLRLNRDYFPTGQSHATAAITSNAAPIPTAPSVTNPSVTTLPNATAQRLQQRGLQVVSSQEALDAFKDPRYQQGLIVFIDARDDAHYAAGHIPNAWQFDHYHPDSFLPGLLPLCIGANKVVVYCTGGECEDSEFAAVMLRDAGVPAPSVYVYTGGITDWKAQGRAIETGIRGSQQFAKP